jgi:hypothetical protein
MERAKKTDTGRKLLIALVIAAVVFAFSPATATVAHAAKAKSEKLTIYKGQKIPVYFLTSNKVTFKSSKSKIVKITNKGKKKSEYGGQNWNFVIQAKKAGKSTLTAKAKNYNTKKYVFTVKKSYPEGSEKTPATIGSNWTTIKSADGKKQLQMKSTIYAGENARNFVNTLEPESATYFDSSYWNDPTVSSGKTFYVIQYDYKIDKGYTASNPAYLSGPGDYSLYDKNWKELVSSTDFVRYALSPSYSGNVTDGQAGSYYFAVFVRNDVKELRAMNVGGIRDKQDMGSFGVYDLIISGCARTVLP